jgi:hypothetical protein
MSGERDLQKLLRAANPSLHPSEFVYCALPDFAVPPDVNPICSVREAEGLTLIVERAEAERYGIGCTFPCRMITLNVHSALDAVGFLAAIMAALAARGISTNAVSGFYHDHLFVPLGREEEALGIVRKLAV